MKSYFVKTPYFVKRIFHTQTWSIPNNEKVIYLTFDDGPIPEVTPWVINLLNHYQIKATFFCIGDNVKKHPDIFNLLIQNDHQIANHTYNHLNGWKTNLNTYLTNSLQCDDLLGKTNAKLFRPPYGKITSKQSKNLIAKGFKIIMWDVLSADFDQSITPQKCLDNVIKNVQSGSIIVFHDSLKAQHNLEYALPKTIEYLLDKGYKFKTL
jgi:peptidoglycan-N-acetylglucosamine deacetylase